MKYNPMAVGQGKEKNRGPQDPASREQLVQDHPAAAAERGGVRVDLIASRGVDIVIDQISG